LQIAALRSARHRRSGFCPPQPTPQWNRADASGGFRERGEVGLDEIGALEQVARRSRTQNNSGARTIPRRARLPFRGRPEFFPVGRKIADGRLS